MTRRTQIEIDAKALLHNLSQVRSYAPQQQVVAMVKANAYGCGIASVVPALDGHVDYFGVACLEEAIAVRALSPHTPCLLLEGIFAAKDYSILAAHQFECVIHHEVQLAWLLEKPLKQPIKIWVKVDTGMHRLGFSPNVVPAVIERLQQCPWVDSSLVLLTHFASADQPSNIANQLQIELFESILLSSISLKRSMANSAAILSLPHTHQDIVRPGIMLYGASPFVDQTGFDLNLKPVMRFTSMIMALHHYPAGEAVGYGGTWQTSRDSIIGVVAVGYGDGYPRHIAPNTPVAIDGQLFPIVGRISMDMLTVDLTDAREFIQLGDVVELWGETISVDTIAKSAGTIAYELMCQITSRVCRQSRRAYENHGGCL